ARACAGWGKTVNGVSSGRTADGKDFVMYHWHSSGGGGAVKGRDGFCVTGPVVSLGGLVLPNAEIYEQLYPCRIYRQEFRLDAAGAGEFRGGPSVEYEAEVFAPTQHALRNEGIRRPSGYGVCGGLDGAMGMMEVSIDGGPFEPAPQYGLQTGGS